MDEPAYPESFGGYVRQIIPVAVQRVVVHVAYVGLALAWLVSVSVPGDLLWPMLLVLPLGAFMTFGWLAWTVHRLANRQPTWWLAVVPTLLTITVALTWIEAPLRLRFSMSQRAFDTAVAAVRAEGTDTGNARGQIGMFHITPVQALPGHGIAFFEAHGYLDNAGFAFLPSPPPARYTGGMEAGRFRHLRGHWYTFTAAQYASM